MNKITDYSVSGVQIIDLSAYTITGSYAKKDGIYKIINDVYGTGKTFVVKVNGKVYTISNANIAKSGNNYVITLGAEVAEGNVAVKVITITNADNAKIETVTASGGETYTLPAATASTLGGVKIGSGLSVEEDGTLSATGGGGSTHAEHQIYENWNGTASRFEIDSVDTPSSATDLDNYSVGDTIEFILRTTEKTMVTKVYGTVVKKTSSGLIVATENANTSASTVPSGETFTTLGFMVCFVVIYDMMGSFNSNIVPKFFT